jgi:hypothetical protein
LPQKARLLGWIALGVLGALSLSRDLGPLYPFLPSPWSVARLEAQAIGVERLRDLGSQADQAVVTLLETDPVLERRLQIALAGGVSRNEPLLRLLSARVVYWSVNTYPPGARSRDWSSRAMVSGQGEIFSLERRPSPAAQSTGEIFPGEARLEATQFLEEQGLRPSAYGEPVVLRRSRVSPLGDELTVRYEALEALGEVGFASGLDVRFVGAELVGFRAWVRDPMADHLSRTVRPWQLLSILRLLAPFPLLVVLIVFAGSGRELPIPVRRAGLWGAVAILLGGAFSVLTARQGASHGWVIGQLDHLATGWIWAALLLLLYLPALALVCWRSIRAGWRGSEAALLTDVAQLEPLISGRWTSPDLAAGCLRGTAAGLALGGGALAVVRLASERLEVWTQASVLLGPWWQQSIWPGVSLAFAQAAVCLSYLVFAWVFLLPRLSKALGRPVGVTLVCLLLALLLGPPVELLPLGFALPLWLFGLLVPTLLYLRFGLVTAMLCTVVSRVVPGALPLAQAQDSTLQAQGWLAISIVALPLVMTIAAVGAGRGEMSK